MQNLQLKRLYLSLFATCITHTCAGLSCDALKPPAHSITSKHYSAAAAGASSSAHSGAGGTSVAEHTSKTSQAAASTPEATFEESRKILVKHFKQFNVSADHPNANKLLDAIKPTITKYLDVPLKLTDKKVTGDSATLTYASTDSNFDFSMTCDFVRSGNVWTMTNQSLKGQKGIELMPELFKDITDAFPAQYALVVTACIGLFLCSLVSSIAGLWLIVVACRASVPWGVATIVIPFAWLAFACMNWQVAKKPFLAMVGAWLAALLTLAVPIGVIYSLRDIASAIPDTLMPKVSSARMHEV